MNNQNYPNQGQNFQQPVYQNAWQGQPQSPKNKKEGMKMSSFYVLYVMLSNYASLLISFCIRA